MRALRAAVERWLRVAEQVERTARGVGRAVRHLPKPKKLDRAVRAAITELRRDDERT